MSLICRMRSIGWVGLVLAAVPVFAAEYHIRTDGSPRGKGTTAESWDLATGLNAVDVVKPGDMVWIHGGTYRGGFASRLTGTAEKPVVIRGFPGDRVTVDTLPRDARDDSLFSILGADAIYRDLEIMCSDPLRQSKFPGPWPADVHRGNVNVRADRVALVNLVLHDLDSGVGFWSQGEGGEINGCLIYNNGWSGPDRQHGHGIYAQNERGTKRIINNVVFHQFGYGMQIYGSKKASIKGFDIAGNVAFMNGCMTRPLAPAQGIMLGGESPAERISVRDNIIWGGGMRLGYPWGTTNADVVCTGNYCDGGLVVRDFRDAIVHRNTVVAESTVVSLEGAEGIVTAGHRWTENEYYVTDGRWGECSVVEQGKSRGLSFKDWQQQTGLDARSRFTKGQPAAPRISLRPSQYERGRANLVIINPSGDPTQSVDLSSICRPGESFRVVSVKDFYGPPVLEGMYRGQPVSVPLKPVAGPPPIGLPDEKLPVTEPYFAAFVVLTGSPAAAR